MEAAGDGFHATDTVDLVLVLAIDELEVALHVGVELFLAEHMDDVHVHTVVA